MTKSFIYILTFSFLIMTVSCLTKKDNESKAALTKSYTQTEKQKYLDIAKNYVETFHLDTTLLLPTVPDSVIISFRALRTFDKVSEEKYLTLYFIKIYHTHIKCTHQGYEIRTSTENQKIDSLKDPMLYEFNSVTGIIDNSKETEFINSAIGFNWVEKNKRLLAYDKIKCEYDSIKVIEKNIEDGIYWR